MGIRDEFKPYQDYLGIVAPSPCDPTKRGSDNGGVFTSEFYIMLAYNNELTEGDNDSFIKLVNAFVQDGYLRRFPGDLTITETDDHHGILAAAKVLGVSDKIPHIKIPFKLWRMPQLFYLRDCHKYKWWKFWMWPTLLWTLGVIKFSCPKSTPLNDQDARRLSWLLIQGVSGTSSLLDEVIKDWYIRLYEDYGPTGMKAVAASYYLPVGNNPFAKNWVTIR